MNEVVTRVIRTRSFEKQLTKIPIYIQKKVLFWIFTIELEGIEEAMKKKGFNDEPLQGKRKGQRSIRLNSAYRLIYRVVEDKFLIEILEVHKHDY